MPDIMESLIAEMQPSGESAPAPKVRRSRVSGHARVLLNRSKLDEIDGALADGVAEIAQAILAAAHPPDLAEGTLPKSLGGGPRQAGRGLVERGGYGVWLNGKKVAEATTGGSESIDKPRSVRVRANKITGVVGWGFPAMFLEFGTVTARARPFFTPAVQAVVGGQARLIVSRAMQRRLQGQRSVKTAAIQERIAAAKAAGGNG